MTVHYPSLTSGFSQTVLKLGDLQTRQPSYQEKVANQKLSNDKWNPICKRVSNEANRTLSDYHKIEGYLL